MNLSVLKQLNPTAVAVDICLVKLDELEPQKETERSGDVEFCG